MIVTLLTFYMVRSNRPLTRKCEIFITIVSFLNLLFQAKTILATIQTYRERSHGSNVMIISPNSFSNVLRLNTIITTV